jgi:hypothetical protein
MIALIMMIRSQGSANTLKASESGYDCYCCCRIHEMTPESVALSVWIWAVIS